MKCLIPKIIHYCWFGGKPKPDDVLFYIETWKRHMPDYEIVEWNEKNVDISNCVEYVKEAYENKKWAFVADYIRLKALRDYGGIYFDTDVQVFKNFDRFLREEAFVGFESKDYLCTAVMGSIKDSWLTNDFLELYEGRHFVLENGNLDMTTTNVVLLTKLLVDHGLKLNGKEQSIDCVHIFPQYYFSPNEIINVFMKCSKHSYSIHHCVASWYDSGPRNGIDKRLYHYLLGKGRNLLGTSTLYNLRNR